MTASRVPAAVTPKALIARTDLMASLTFNRSTSSGHRLSALTASILFASILGTAATISEALTLGSERVVSYLGQSLRVEIPISAGASESWDLNCFALAPAPRRDGVLALRDGRLSLSPGRDRLLVRSVSAIEDPAVKFVIDVGCEAPLKREFTVLLDPAPINIPTIVAPTTESPATPTTTAAAANATTSATATTSSAPAPAQRAQTLRRDRATVATDRSRSASAAKREAPRRSAKAPDSRLVLKGNDATIDDASLAALAVPRLKISGDLPSWAASESPVGPAGVAPLDELAAAIAKDRRARLANTPIEEDLPARLEADLIVAKKRIAELQSQLSAANPDSAGQAPNSTPLATSAPKASVAQSNKTVIGGANTGTTFSWMPWILAPIGLLLVGVLGLLAARRSKQRAAASAWAPTAPVTIVQRSDDETQTRARAARAETDDEQAFAQVNALDLSDSSPPTITQMSPATTSASDARARLENPLFHPNQTASSVDVSELSHITDEAQVYADLGRTNEAIEILAHHIDTHESDRPSPAPWLMLFDLFRKANRRADYDRLSPLFRKNFNGRLPEWDDYGNALALDDGLEAFPHLIARIERDWGTPNARALLDELLHDNRGGSRLGFSLSAYRDLLLLLQLHDQLAHDNQLGSARAGESAGADHTDGTPKWDLSLDMIEPPKPGELDDFLKGRP